MSTITRFTSCALRPAFRAQAFSKRPTSFLQATLSARRAFHPRTLKYESSRLGLGLGLGLAGLATTGLVWNRQPIKCDVVEEELPESGLNIQNLGFGTAAGICSGVL